MMLGIVIGVVIGLGVAAILHGVFDEVSSYLRTKKTRR